MLLGQSHEPDAQSNELCFSLLTIISPLDFAKLFVSLNSFKGATSDF